jgi:hypothetical protein
MMDFTVIAASRHRFGDDVRDENSLKERERHLEIDAPFVGLEKTFQFACPNVDPSQFGILLFQIQGVQDVKHTFELNGQTIFGGLHRSVEVDQRNKLGASGDVWTNINALWIGTVALINPGMLRASNALLIRVKEYDTIEERDDFVIDNMVIMYKTAGNRPVPGDFPDVFEPVR